MLAQRNIKILSQRVQTNYRITNTNSPYHPFFYGNPDVSGKLFCLKKIIKNSTSINKQNLQRTKTTKLVLTKTIVNNWDESSLQRKVTVLEINDSHSLSLTSKGRYVGFKTRTSFLLKQISRLPLKIIVTTAHK